jgi:hypothetical protein
LRHTVSSSSVRRAAYAANATLGLGSAVIAAQAASSSIQAGIALLGAFGSSFGRIR